MTVLSLSVLLSTAFPFSHALRSATPTLMPTTSYCSTETFRASCPQGQVVVLDEARYGRMAIGRCVTTNFGYLPCFDNVGAALDRRCSGRRSCQVRVPDAELDRGRPCSQPDLERYLEVSYRCWQVDRPLSCEVTSQASVVLDAPSPTGCGLSGSPYRVVASPTQRVNVTIYDFRTAAFDGSCDRLGELREETKDRKFVICAGSRRVRNLLLTEGSGILLYTSGGSEAPRFLLHFEAVGCLEPRIPDGMWSRVAPDVVELGCKFHSFPSWKLHCNHGEWKGELGNCSDWERKSPLSGKVLWGLVSSMPSELAILIIITIALLISLAILLVGIACIKRRRVAGTSSTSAIHQQGFLEPKTSNHPGRARSVSSVDDGKVYRTRMDPYRAYGLNVDVPDDGRIGGSRPIIEHIYESPVFSRKHQPRSHYLELNPVSIEMR